MRQAGRYLPEYRAVRAVAGSFLELCYTPKLAARVTLQPVERFGLDAAILFSDILVVPHALGMNVSFLDERGPVLDGLNGNDAVARLEPGTVIGRLGPVFETIRRARAELAPDRALIGFAGAPWTVATYMVEGGTSREFRATKRWAYGDPEGFARLIDVIVEATSDYLVAQVEAGADVLQIFDSWCGVLPEAEFNRWCIEPTAAIIRKVRRRAPDVPVIGFPRGAGAMLPGYVERTGVTAVSLDATVPLAWARTILPPTLALQGNLDPIALLEGGPVLDAHARRILDALAGAPFVFNLGHGILPETPPENVARLVSIVREHRP
ncbi:MAG: uroporphyrinogen decarboxylase [Alphaproteobacteria bacterium]